MENKEFTFKGCNINGFLMLFILLLLLAQFPFCLYYDIVPVFSAFIAFCAFISFFGLVMLEPNQARAMLFFGKYRGTYTKTGLRWVNPFLTKRAVSLRARNLNVNPIKVNDKNGNPILIGLVLVWKVNNIYKALFDIDSQVISTNNKGQIVTSANLRMNAFEDFVRVQSDAALRQVAGLYAYDTLGDEKELTLREGGNEINQQLEDKLNERLSMAGIEVIEARLNYLAYAPEIAAVMLRRQQAEAIIAAREKIVEGAVTMVKMALDELAEKNVVELDDDKKAAMVSNLLVVLCADESASPVINTGTLHQ